MFATVALAVTVFVTVAAVAIAADVRDAVPASAGITTYPVAATTLTVHDPTRPTAARGTVPAHQGRTLPTTVWFPLGTSDDLRPLIVFAHGYNSSAQAYAPLLSKLAAAGYIVAAPELPASSSTIPGPPGQADIPNTPGDLSVVITNLLSASNTPGNLFYRSIDPARIGAMGHSDGGSTVAALALHPAKVDARVKATAILAGAIYTIPGAEHGPVNPGAVLVVQGTDDQVNDYANGPALYATAADPRALVDVEGGGHLTPFVGAGTLANTVRATIIGFFDSRLQQAADGTFRFFAAARTAGITKLATSGIGFDPHVPVGEVRSWSSPSSERVVVSGWTLDPDTTEPIDLRVLIDGVAVAQQPADAGDLAVGHAYPGFGTPHGFEVVIDRAAPGAHSVCAIGVNTGSGSDTSFGCHLVTVRDGRPFGWVNTWSSAFGRVGVAGWTIDPDTYVPIDVQVTVDGALRRTVTADAGRADVGQVYPAWSTPHGFDVSVTGLSAGSHVVCVIAVNAGVGADRTIECRTVVVPSISGTNDPMGWVNTWSSGVGELSVTGWMIDPDTFAPIDARISVDGQPVLTATAHEGRADVGQVYPAWGTPHGFAVTLTNLVPGPHTVCVTAIDAGPGADRLLECRVIAIPSATAANDPFGWVQMWAPAGGRVFVSGWMIDPDTYAPIDMGVWIDGLPALRATADEGHADVGQVYPAWSTPHGFDRTITGLVPGSHNVCIYALNSGAGTHVLIECRTMTT